MTIAAIVSSPTNRVAYLLSSLKQILDDLRCMLDSDEAEGKKAAGLKKGSHRWMMMEKLVDKAGTISAEDWQQMIVTDPSLQSTRSWLAGPYCEYICIKEAEEAPPFLKRISDAGSSFNVESLTPWGVSAYTRVRDLFDHVDLSDCKHLIMIGSGTLPVTIMHIHERTRIPQLTAVDTDPNAIANAKALWHILAWDRIQMLCCDGLAVDYTTADAIYIANLVSPKRDVLELIGEQVKSGTQVIVRDAVGIGEIFAERVEGSVPSCFQVKGFGEGHSRFHSLNMFLVKV